MISNQRSGKVTNTVISKATLIVIPACLESLWKERLRTSRNDRPGGFMMGKHWKVDLVRKSNPTLRDLYEDIIGRIPAIPDKRGQALPDRRVISLKTI